ncbi:hypothetical protein niasHS_013336 [Heterodera schachtii]|uniref:Rnh202 triple barrel domain-containing protein n=1 Tax=Heterodera schachtii TaxID=97005 RepID=A0ABD2IAX8_HETSC
MVYDQDTSIDISYIYKFEDPLFEVKMDESLGNKRRRHSTVKEDDSVSLCGSVATTAAGDRSLLDFGLGEETFAVESDTEFERKFFVMKEGSFPGKVFALPHPASRERALYLLNEHGELFELLRLDNGKRSFFFGDSVVANGSVHLFFPVHPFFLAIECLQRNACEHFLTASELLEDDDFPSLKELAKSVKLIDTLKIAANFENDNSTDSTKNFKFRHNEQRLFIWLEERFRILKESLAANCDENDNCAEDEQCFGILADYLPELVAQRLKERLDIKMPKNKNQQKTKRILVEPIKGTEAKGARTAKRKLTKVLAEASKGSHSIASLFGSNKTDKK